MVVLATLIVLVYVLALVAIGMAWEAHKGSAEPKFYQLLKSVEKDMVSILEKANKSTGTKHVIGFKMGEVDGLLKITVDDESSGYFRVPASDLGKTISIIKEHAKTHGYFF